MNRTRIILDSLITRREKVSIDIQQYVKGLMLPYDIEQTKALANYIEELTYLHVLIDEAKKTLMVEASQSGIKEFK